MFGVLIPWQPIAGLIAFAAWLIAIWLSRYVALASILAGLTLPIAAWLLGASAAAIYACVFFCILMTLRHQSNIQRLLAGTENRVGGSTKRAE